MEKTEQLDLYEQDYYLWLETTAKQLKKGSLKDVDLANLIEEIESLGRKERAELRNRLKILFEHMLKVNYWEKEKEWNQRGWNLTIKEQKLQIKRLMADSPSLKSQLQTINREAYEDALEITKEKTGLDNLPEENPFDMSSIF